MEAGALILIGEALKSHAWITPMTRTKPSLFSLHTSSPGDRWALTLLQLPLYLCTAEQSVSLKESSTARAWQLSGLEIAIS